MSQGYLKHKLIIIIIAVLAIGYTSGAQDISLIALGDIHYDRLELHDWDYVRTRPQDFKQIMNEYPQYTAVYLPDFLSLVKRRTVAYDPPVKAVVQLGDLVEGVAGTAVLSRAMDRAVVDMLYSVDLPVPWILVKGNHDVSNSPGQPEAWREVIEPFIESQTGRCANDGMYTFKPVSHTEFFILDQFFSNDRDRQESEMVEWLEEKMAQSDARYKFILTHQPVIPVTDRCWHLLSGLRRKVIEPGLRERFLNLLGRHNAIVLCAHLHRYSVLRRDTESGPIVQVMVNSVNRGFESQSPVLKEKKYYGGAFVSENPDFQPSTNEIRRRILDDESKFIKYYQDDDIPGYAVISIHESSDSVILSYYNGFSSLPYQTINLTNLQKD